jgi:RNA polymerase sigma factor (sigma-70 family)
MATGQFTALLRLLVGDKSTAGSDRQLLERFVAERDEVAFAGLVDRHGRLVFQLCRSVLHNEQDAEDAFQATFLVLARLASSIRKRDSLANWLHGVALRTALKARRAMTTRHRIERQGSVPSQQEPVSEAALREVQTILHEEIHRLPEKYRAPFVLCCLEGKSRAEAAQQLGWKDGTVSGRIAQARALLQERLARRGVVLPVALAAAALLPDPATAAVPMIVQAAVAIAAGRVPETVSPFAASLAQGVIQAMLVTKLKTIAAVPLILVSVLAGGGLLTYAAWQLDKGKPAVGDPPPNQSAKTPDQPNPPASDNPERSPQFNSSLETPLPAGAIVRLGTTRFRPGHAVGPMKLSPDGKKLITGGPGYGLFVWDANSGQQIMRLPSGIEGEISRDGERLFVIESQPVLPAPPPDDPKAISVIVSGTTASPDPVEVRSDLNVYQLTTGKRIQQIQIQRPKQLAHFTVAPDERTVVLEYAIPDGKNEGTGGDWADHTKYKCRLELCDLKAGRIAHDLGDLPFNYYGNLLRFSADGKTLFAVTSSPEDKNNRSTVRRFDVATGALKSKTTIDGYGYRTPLNSQGKTLIALGKTIWDLDKERPHWVSKAENLESILAFLPDGRTLIAYAREKTVAKFVEWDMQADREIRVLPARSIAAISLDGKTCFSAAWASRWFRWDLASGKEIDSVDAATEPTENIAFSADGKYVATLNNTFSPDNNFDREKYYYAVRVWDRRAGKCLHQIPAFYGNALFFTADSTTLAYGAAGSSFLTLDTTTWKEAKREFELLPAPQFQYKPGMDTYHCRLSPDGKMLASTAALWDWASGKMIGKLEHPFAERAGTDHSGPFAISPDGKQLACLGYVGVAKDQKFAAFPQKRVQIWNLPDRKLISDKLISDWPTEQKNGLTWNIHFIDGGKLLAASWMPPRPPWRGMLRWPEDVQKPIPDDWPATVPPMPDGVLRVWDSATGKDKFRLQFPQNENVSGIPPLCSPDGKLAVTANYSDGLVRFWDLAGGKEVGQFRCPSTCAHFLAFSPDSEVLAVSATDTTVLLVDVRKVIGK